MKTAETTHELRWLVLSRNQIQKLLIELLDLGFLHHKYLQTGTKTAKKDLWLFALLAGAGFGLWRSAFLLSKSAKRPTLYQDSITFLDNLIRNNTVGYMQDVATQAWSGGHYLNNGILRLNLAMEELGVSAHDPLCMTRISYDVNLHRPKWRHERKRLEMAISLLETRLELRQHVSRPKETTILSRNKRKTASPRRV